MKMQFSDNSYIEENSSGLIYVGVIANEVGHIIRKTGCTLEEFKKAYGNLVDDKLGQLKTIMQLKKCGHSNERITSILEEAKQSSNPQYILNYYGAK